jgi:D-alanyl-D-alanine carboxypeptidase
MNRKWITQALAAGLVLSSLPIPAAAAYQEAYVIPRLVAGGIDGFVYTPKLSFRNLSNKQCDGRFQLLEGDFQPAAGVFEFTGIRIGDGILPVSLSPGEGLSGKLRKIDAGGYAGFGFWRQDGACAAGQDVVLTADVEVGKVQADNRYVIVDQIGFTASSRPSQRWGFAVRKEGTAESGDATAFAVVPSEPGPYGLTVDFFPESGIGQWTRKGATTGPLAVFVYQLFGQDLPANFAGYVTVSADKPVYLEALTVAWGAGVQGGIQYSNFPVQADAAVPHTRQISAENLQHALDQIRNDYNIVGVSAALVVHGQLVWTGASGNSFPGAPIASDMYFDIGSAAKNFVAALVLKLSEEGALSLEDPLSRWLPNFVNVDSRVTIRQLLDHTSGIYNFTANQSFWDAVFSNPSRRWLPEEVLSYIGPPDFPPGASWNYSNTNYTLLGMIAQKAAGSSLSAALRRRLLDPLGLTNTFLEAEERVPGTIVHGWFDRNGDGRYDDISDIDRTSQTTAAWGAGGMVSTAADVARWACALFEGKVLSGASLSQMLAFREVSVPPTPIVGYGLGALRALFSGREYWGHGGNMIGYTAIMLYAPKERVSVALLINQDYVDYAVGPPLLGALVDAVRP